MLQPMPLLYNGVKTRSTRPKADYLLGRRGGGKIEGNCLPGNQQSVAGKGGPSNAKMWLPVLDDIVMQALLSHIYCKCGSVCAPPPFKITTLFRAKQPAVRLQAEIINES